MKTGERIKTIRKSQGITQAKLAETLHISSSFMSRIENGSSNPSNPKSFKHGR